MVILNNMDYAKSKRQAYCYEISHRKQTQKIIRIICYTVIIGSILLSVVIAINKLCK